MTTPHFIMRKIMTHRLLPLVISATLMAGCANQPAATMRQEDDKMRQQADSFLRQMPVGLQQRQAAAIRRAMAGHSRGLDSVRHSRNAAWPVPTGVSSRTLSPTLRLYEPAGAAGRKLPTLIYLHGGGWTFGSINSCSRFCGALAASGAARVVAVDYRLAPENPFPAGLEDCAAAVRYVTENATELGTATASVAIGGDSSGGNLAVATALSAECRGKIAKLVLFYPVTLAIADGSASWREYGRGYGLDSDIMEAFDSAYVGAADTRDPRISVGLLPPDTLRALLPQTLLVAAGRDILRDQGKDFATRAGHRARREELPEAVHLFITVPGQDEAFGTAVRLAADFLKE